MQVLLKEEEAKRERKRQETKIALEKIKQRISLTLEDYNSHDDTLVSDCFNDPDAYIDFASIVSPTKLYEILSDARARAKYQRQLMICLISFEEKCEAKEQVLLSLDDFFQETRSIVMNKILIDNNADPEDETSLELENVIESTMGMASKLSSIVKEISQILTVTSTYPDNKKGRKKLEKALIKAKDQIQELSETVQSSKVALERSKEEYNIIKKTLETKTAECTKLQKAATQVKLLEVENNSLKFELKNVEAKYEKAKQDTVEVQAKATTEAANEIKELRIALDSSQKAYQKIKNEKDQSTNKLLKTISKMKKEHEEEMVKLQQLQHEDRANDVSKAVDIEYELEIFEENDEKEEGSEKSMNIDMKQDAAIVPDIGIEKEASDDIELEEVTSKNFEPITTNSNVIVSSSMSEGEAIAITALQKEYTEKENSFKNEIHNIKKKSKMIITSLKDDLNKMKNQLNKAAEKVKELQSFLNESEKEKDKLKQERKLLLDERAELLQLRHEQERRIADFENKIETLRHSLQVAEVKLSLVAPPKEKVSRSTQCLDSFYLFSSSFIVSTDRTYSDIPVEGLPSYRSSLCSPVKSAPTGLSRFSRSPRTPHSGKFPRPNTSLSYLLHHNDRPESVTFDHPIVAECMKTFTAVMKFKDKVSNMINAHANATGTNFVTDTEKISKSFSLDMSKEVQGQVTQMRFAISSTLQELHSGLQGFFSIPIPSSSSKEGRMKLEVDQLYSQIDELKQKMQDTNEKHEAELYRSQNAVANLIIEVDDLKSEILHLRQLLNHSNLETVYFTRLDAKRNEKALQEARKKDQISEEEFKSITSSMREYVSIPSQQFQSIAQQLSQEMNVKKTISNVCQTAPSPEQMTRAIHALQHFQDKKQKVFHQKMDALSSKRLSLASNIQSALTKTEMQTGLFLVKPIYPIRPHSSLMTPLQRAPPQAPLHIHEQTSTFSRNTNRGINGPHPALRLISDIHSTSNSHHYQDIQDSSKNEQTSTSSCNTNRGINGSHPAHHLISDIHSTLNSHHYQDIQDSSKNEQTSTFSHNTNRGINAPRHSLRPISGIHSTSHRHQNIQDSSTIEQTSTSSHNTNHSTRDYTNRGINAPYRTHCRISDIHSTSNPHHYQDIQDSSKNEQTSTSSQNTNRGINAPHPTLRRISDMHSTSNHYQNIQDSFTSVLETPHSQQASLYTESSPKWSVVTSRANSAYHHTFSPVIPRMIELETSRLREPVSLLKTSHLSKSNNSYTNSTQKPQSTCSLPPVCVPSLAIQ